MVAPAIIAAGLTAGGSLLGGLFGSSGAKQGGKMAARATLKAARMNANWQRKFAQKAIQWKVRDAKRAGVSPLAALGAQTTSFAPSFVGATQAGQGVADAAAAMGQGITRAGSALGDYYERAQSADYVSKLQGLQLQNMELQNTALASQIAQIAQPGNPPAGPVSQNRYSVPGQGSTVTGVEDGTFPDIAFSTNADGSRSVLPGKVMKERMEDNVALETQWIARQAYLINNGVIKPGPTPQGKKWVYDVPTNRAYLVDAYNPVVRGRPDTDWRGPQRMSNDWFVKTKQGWDFNF